jgi:hypothetical protein
LQNSAIRFPSWYKGGCHRPGGGVPTILERPTPSIGIAAISNTNALERGFIEVDARTSPLLSFANIHSSDFLFKQVDMTKDEKHFHLDQKMY